MAKEKSRHGGRRGGAGRPAIFRDAVLFQLRLERADVEAFRRLAKRKGLAMQELMRRALRAYLRRYAGRK